MLAPHHAPRQDLDEARSRRQAIDALRRRLTFLYTDANEAHRVDPAGDAAGVLALDAWARDVIAGAAEALDVIAALCEARSLAGAADAGREVREVREVEDVVAIARMSLRPRRAALEGLAEGATELERLSAIDDALHAVQKSLSAVERTLAASVRAQPSTDFYRESVAGSLELRRRYVRFHRAAFGDGAPPPEGLADRLASIVDASAALLAPAPRRMRPDDRAAVASLTARIHAHLSRAPGERDAPTARRLFQDVVVVSTALLEIHKREELVLHDVRVAESALATLATAGEDDLIPPAALVTLLGAIEGRSPELDALTARAPDDLSNGELRAALLAIPGVRRRGAPSTRWSGAWSWGAEVLGAG